jgi:hypothetical protein
MFRLLCLLLAVVLPGTCSPLEIRRVAACSGVVGDINEGDYSRLRCHFNAKETIVGLDLSSDGGSLEEGLRIAKLEPAWLLCGGAVMEGGQRMTSEGRVRTEVHGHIFKIITTTLRRRTQSRRR